MQNDLDRPLGLEPRSFNRRSWRRQLSSGHVAGFGTALLLLVVVGYASVFGSGDDGHARSIGRIADAPAPTRPVATISREDTTGSIPPALNGTATATDIERASGVKVTRGDGSAAPGALIIRLDQALGRLAPAPDPGLTERTKLGVLPKIGTDGSRASHVYARPFAVDPARAGAPKIALLIGGLGLSATTTRDAIEKLPPAVTFAFAPYGADLVSDAAAARERGHESVLQLPMEPLDSARNDPGPHTLQLAASASETDADLRWLLSRFPGYFAVSPFLGGRFLQSADAVTPVLRELAARGIALVDDGAAARSVLEVSAGDVGVPTIRATVRLDADGDKGFEAALTRLEAAARKDGFAVGTANALPGTVDRLAKWTAGLETRGFVLAPVSASPVRAGAVAQGGDARR